MSIVKNIRLVEYANARRNQCYMNAINYLYETGLYRNPDYEIVSGYYGENPKEHFWIKNTRTDEHFEITTRMLFRPYIEDPQVKERWESEMSEEE